MRSWTEALSGRKKSLGTVFVPPSCCRSYSPGSEVGVCIHEFRLHQVGAGVNGPQSLPAALRPGHRGWGAGLWAEGVGDQSPGSRSAGLPRSPGARGHQALLSGQLWQPRDRTRGGGRAQGGEVKLRVTKIQARRISSFCWYIFVKYRICCEIICCCTKMDFLKFRGRSP